MGLAWRTAYCAASHLCVRRHVLLDFDFEADHFSSHERSDYFAEATAGRGIGYGLAHLGFLDGNAHSGAFNVS